jgi:flagellar biosynthesis chaperone FliJ
MKDLTGKGKPFHSSLDKAAALLKRKVGTGAEFMQELKGLGGIKQAEIDERKLGEVMGMPRMTHDQFMETLNAKPAPAIRQITFGEEPSPEDIIRTANEDTRAYAKNYADQANTSQGQRMLMNDEIRRLRGKHRESMKRSAKEALTSKTEHEQWTLPGGENYREMLIKAPEDSGEIFKGVQGHFAGEPGILASMRLKDRKGPNGEKLLHLEELQSDWHQQGRESGYKGNADKEYTNYLNNLQERVKQTIKQEYLANGNISDERAESLAEKMAQRMADDPRKLANFAGEEDKRMELNQARVEERNLVPDAPFKKNWEEMALKRLIHHAAEKGYHGIVVTPGAEQADRYSLAQHVDEISHYPRTDARTGEKSKSVRIDMKRGNPLQLGVNSEGVVDNVSVAEHANFKGKHISDIVGKEHAKNIMGAERGQISGEGLTVGGEGMKGFYDKKVPNILNTIGKKYGVKTELNGHKLKVGDDLNFPEETSRRNNLPSFVAGETKDVHHFPITEDMRKDILTNGLPLYNEGGVVHKAEGGAVNAFDYENPEHTQRVAHHLSNHADFKKAVAPDMDIKKILNEMLSKGEHRFVEDPRTQAAIHKAGHSHYYVQEKTGKVKYPIQHVVKKAFGGSVNEMRAEMMGRKPVSLNDLTTIGANEAPDMNVKAYVPPSNQEQLPVGGVSTNQGALPIGGVDMNSEQQGHQIGLQGAAPQPPQGDQPTPPQGQPSPLSAGASSPSQQSNILQMTPQGQALNAMKPPQQPMPQMAMGGRISSLGGVINDEDEEISPLQKAYQEQLTNDDDGDTNFSVDDTSYLAKGGGVQGYASKGYVTHTTTKPDPVVGTRFKATPQGNLVKRKNLNIENYENKGSIVGIPYDATTRDNLITEVSGHSLTNPLLTEAGFDYSMDPKHVKKGIGGASNLGIASRVQGRIDAFTISRFSRVLS